MHFTIFVIFVLFTTTIAEKGSSCVTPNGEQATCESIDSCTVIKKAIKYLDKDEIEFARNSQCGHDGTPLVCCGSHSRLTTPEPIVTEPSPKVTRKPKENLVTATPIKNFLLPDDSLCGLQSQENRTSHGRVAELDEYPWVVALKYTKDDGSPGGFRCSGTLINQRYVLTAARCLNITGFKLVEVRLGEWNFSSQNDCFSKGNETVCAGVIDKQIIEKIPHPYYDSKRGNDDIALLRMEDKVKYSDGIRPICLPPNDYAAPPVGTLMEISGWDVGEDGSYKDAKVKEVITMVGHEECNAVFTNYTVKYPNYACVGSDEDKNLCIRDSGRPLLRTYDKEDETEERQWFQEGIKYQDSVCGTKRSPELYLRVSRYINWILNNIKKS